MRRLTAPLWIVFSSALAFAAPNTACRDADLLLRNGHIVTVDADFQIFESLAVRDGKILAVGSDADLESCASPRTKIVDLRQRTVLPGLIDVHTHAMEWTRSILRGEIDAAYPRIRSIADIQQKVHERAATLQPGQWILGSNWDDAKFSEHRYLTRADLDSAAPQNPVYLIHISGHLAAANSRALALAGISRETPNPQGGAIERDSHGEPTGILKDTAMALLARVLPADPPDINARAVKLASEEAARVGLTTIHDIYLLPEESRAYQDADRNGWIKIRVQMSPAVGSLADAERLAHLGVYTGFGNDHLRFGAAKMFADGGMGARTIAIYPPGVIGEPENVGLLRWKLQELEQAQLLVASAGWQLETHAIGDRAIDQVLDSYAYVQQKLHLLDARFRIVHCGVSTPSIQKRLHEQHVIVDGNPPFVYWIGSWFAKYGPERVRWSYPAKSYIDNGVIEAAGSDVNVTPISPWWGLWAAVERKEILSGSVLAPEERITIRQALVLYTRNGAYAGFEEKEKGSLEPGKLADFIVIDRDVLAVPADQIKDVQVLTTYVGGVLVYERK